jgi:hypothetical protein
MLLRTGILVGFPVNHNREPSPLFFVSVASKGLSQSISLLFATLAGRCISVAAKGLIRAKRRREISCVGWEDFERVRGKCAVSSGQWSARSRLNGGEG